MEQMIDKTLRYILDVFSVYTAYLGFVTGTDLALALGMLASVMSFLNHFIQWRERIKKRRNSKNKNIEP